jgi:hypothetical protein
MDPGRTSGRMIFCSLCHFELLDVDLLTRHSF